MLLEKTSPWSALRGMRAAFVSFSRLPLGGYPYQRAEWQWAAAHLPLVGAVIGSASAAVLALGHAARLSPWLCAGLALATSVALTGGLHEDGLSDAADGLGGAGGGARALEIMKDPRIGNYGALALIFSVLLRAAALAELEPRRWLVLVQLHCLARVGPVWLMRTEPYVSSAASAKSTPFFPAQRVQLVVALGWGSSSLALSFFGGLAWYAAGWVVLALCALTWACARYFRRAVGGVTGDLLGAVEQLGEIAGWLTWLILARA